jgi:hypothetical protein
VSGSYPELVKGYQRAVTHIVDDIAMVIMGASSGSSLGCPND